jgi:hypothetical protein
MLAFPGVDDMTLSSVQGSAFRGLKVKPTLDAGVNVFYDRLIFEEEKYL